MQLIPVDFLDDGTRIKRLVMGETTSRRSSLTNTSRYWRNEMVKKISLMNANDDRATAICDQVISGLNKMILNIGFERSFGFVV